MDSKIEPNPASATRSNIVIVTGPSGHDRREDDDVLLSMQIDLATLSSVSSKLHHGIYRISDSRRIRIGASMIRAAVREMEHATALS